MYAFVSESEVTCSGPYHCNNCVKLGPMPQLNAPTGKEWAPVWLLRDKTATPQPDSSTPKETSFEEMLLDTVKIQRKQAPKQQRKLTFPNAVVTDDDFNKGIAATSACLLKIKKRRPAKEMAPTKSDPKKTLIKRRSSCSCGGVYLLQTLKIISAHTK